MDTREKILFVLFIGRNCAFYKASWKIAFLFFAFLRQLGTKLRTAFVFADNYDERGGGNLCN